MTEYVRSTVSSIGGINTELTKIKTALDDKIGRKSSGPRIMEADLDLNGNQLLNIPTPKNPTDPVRFQDLLDYASENVDDSLRADLANVNSTVPLAGLQASLFRNVSWRTPRDYGAVPNTDSSAAINALFLNELYIVIDDDYWCSSCIRPRSDQTVIFYKGSLKTVKNAGGVMTQDYGGIWSQFIIDNVSNFTMIDAAIDGNEGAFGGRIVTGDATTKPHGILVLTNCDNINIIRPRLNNISNFACIHLSNGVLGQSRDVLFENPAGANCGGGVGVEIFYAGTPVGGLYGVSPGKTVFSNGNFTTTHFPAYIAGCEDLQMSGGYYSSDLQNALTLYTGDAQGVLNAVIDGGVYSNALAPANGPLLVRSVNIAPENTSFYKHASKLKAVINSARFESVAAGSASSIYDNSDVELNSVEFSTGRLLLQSEFVDAVGVITTPCRINGGNFKQWSGKAVIASFDLRVGNTVFQTSVAGSNDCITLSGATPKLWLQGTKLGNSESSPNTVRHGVELDNPNRVQADGVEFYGSGSQYSVIAANSYNIESYSSTPANAFDTVGMRQSATIPTHTPSAGQARIYANTAVVSGQPSFWVWNGSAWVGVAIMP